MKLFRTYHYYEENTGIVVKTMIQWYWLNIKPQYVNVQTIGWTNNHKKVRTNKIVYQVLDYNKNSKTVVCLLGTEHWYAVKKIIGG